MSVINPFKRMPLLVISVLTLLVSCSDNEPVTHAGVVQDGYIKGATVCVDLNANGTCDGGEPATLSHGDTGQYALSSGKDAAIVAYVGAGAVDMDTDTAVAAPYTMVAPAGYGSVVNPLTTLVHAEMLANGVDADTAQAQVIAGLGLGAVAILDYDYQDGNDTATHDMAKIVAGLLANVQALTVGSQTDDIVNKSLVALVQAIGQAIDGGLAPADLATVEVAAGDVFAVNLDVEGNPRNAAGHPGDVEVIAGTGYKHTLLDSAENKCQHCHNDLYDTWQKSMHAQSWEDPIFQSKFQDFLRLNISKIGTSGPSGDYTPAKFKGVAQTCIRCHAPGAFYSGDFDVQLTELSQDPAADFATAKADNESNLAGTAGYDAHQVTNVVSVSNSGIVYQAGYHIGNKHNREGINCAFCHSIETVRMMNGTDDDLGAYKLAKNIVEGPIGPVVRTAGETLYYSADANDADMNAFFRLWGPEKYTDPGATPKVQAEFDVNKTSDGRYTMKSIQTGKYTGGPYYGPYGITGIENSRADDDSDRAALVKQSFVDAGRNQHFEDYGKGLCLSCHQRSAGALNPESDGVAGKNPATDQFMELCSTWTVMSNAVDDNYTSTASSPKCQKCHMERVDNKVVLHKWNDPSTLFTTEEVTNDHFDPASGTGPVALGYLNNHAFMGANKKDFGLGKIKSGFESSVAAVLNGSNIDVTTSLLNKTAHMFPGAHPMRRVLTRMVVTDANGTRLDYTAATGNSTFENVVNTLATLPGETIYPGKETVAVDYVAGRNISFPGQELDLSGAAVSNQKFDSGTVTWKSPDSTVSNVVPVETSPGVWAMEGAAGINKIIDDIATDTFTRIYGRETGKKDPADANTFVVRPGFDSNIARDNRLLPNERETYSVTFDASAAAFPVTVNYKVYYMKKGASGKFPTAADGFLNTALDATVLKKLTIDEVFSDSVQIDAPI